MRDEVENLKYDWRYFRRRGPDFRSSRRDIARAYWLLRRFPGAAEHIISIGRDNERYEHTCF